MGKCLFMRKGETHTTPKQGLPAGYTKLAYIQSSGTQYINTGFSPNQDTRVDIDVSHNHASGSYEMFGADVSWTGNGYSVLATNCHYGTQTTSITTFGDGARHTVSLNKNVLSVDGTVKWTATYSAFSVGHPIAICALNRAGSVAEHSTQNVYSCQIYDNDTLVRDYVPCVNASGEAGLYDLVGKQFYGNAGTGTFTGSEVA